MKQLACAILFSSAISLAAATLTVGKPNTGCSQAQYTAIGDAVKAASAGDLIEICPALYQEQLTITKPLTLLGRQSEVAGLPVSRVVIQPASVATTVVNDGAVSAPVTAVISVIGANGVTIRNLAIDAGQNQLNGCALLLAGIYFHNSSGEISNNAIFGAQVPSCIVTKAVQNGTGFGVVIDTDTTGTFSVLVDQNSIHDYSKDGVLAVGAGVTATVSNNTISGKGPSAANFQFGIFVENGAVAHIRKNFITEGLCGVLSVSACLAVRSEGVTLKAVGDGTTVDGNTIVNAQSGIFVNGANLARITNNQIRNIDAGNGIDIQGTASGAFTHSLIAGNMISNVGPIDQNASLNERGCGIEEYSGTGVSGNTLMNNSVFDAYCGIASVEADFVGGGLFLNTLYSLLDSDLYPTIFPPATEP
jgi:nitrous oxidase accessory protein NosD